MVFNATVNNISVISWRSVLLVEETRVLGENHRPVASHWQTLSHNIVSSTPRDLNSQPYLWLMICTDCTCNCKSNYHTTTTTPWGASRFVDKFWYYYIQLFSLIKKKQFCVLWRLKYEVWRYPLSIRSFVLNYFTIMSLFMTYRRFINQISLLYVNTYVDCICIFNCHHIEIDVFIVSFLLFVCIGKYLVLPG